MNMKYKIPFFSLILFIHILFSACSSQVYSTSHGGYATVTVDPCSSMQLPLLAEPITDLLISFDDTSFVASYTPQEQKAGLIMQLQDLRRQLTKIEVPYCLADLKKFTQDYMNSVIVELTYSMGGVDSDQIDEEVRSSQMIRNILNRECRNVLGVTYEPPNATIPDTGSLIATAQMTPSVDATIVVKNESYERVNIRSLPNLNAPIIGGMLPGEILIGFGKDETSEWVMVEFNEKIGWVNASVVSLNYSLNILPVVPND